MRNRRHLRSSREPACIRSNPEPIHMRNLTLLSESLTIPKPAVSAPGTSAPQPLEVAPLKESRETTCSKEPESSSQTVKVPEQSSPSNQSIVQLPEVAECPDHQVTLRTLLLLSDIVYHSSQFQELRTLLFDHLVLLFCIHQ